MTFKNTHWMALVTSTVLALPAAADQVFFDDLIVEGSACIGQDCSNGESFGFDTIRMKENNLRLHFDDTSNSASFPNNDWRISANDSSNGGDNKLAFEDATAGRQVMVIEAGAPASALVVSDSGGIGMGTSNPIVELHVANGDSPTLRLEQNGSSGFTPQTFDIASNEANFFVRDVTNGSQLPFRVIPGADTNSLVIAADNDVGIGTLTPTGRFHVRTTANISGPTEHVLFENANNAQAQRTMLTLRNNGGSQIILDNTAAEGDWRLAHANGGNQDFLIFTSYNNTAPLTLTRDGNLTVTGNFFTAAGQLNVPDYVFADDYELRPLADVRAFIDANSHLPEIPSAAQIGETGLNMTEMQMSLLKKVEELTLYTLAQEDKIRDLQQRLDAQ